MNAPDFLATRPLLRTGTEHTLDPTTAQALHRLHRAPEPNLLPGLLTEARVSEDERQQTQTLALTLAGAVRERQHGLGRAGLVQALLQEFALSSQEGVALMCLAEALLRIPDAATRDALIRDKIAGANWAAHLGSGDGVARGGRSIFVHAATWGLLLTGKLVATHSDNALESALKRIIGLGGEPLIRKSVDLAMRLMGEQFVTGQTIEEALERATPREADGFGHSYDMLGEAALTEEDAQAYLAAYQRAIEAIGRAAGGRGPLLGPGISIKLSAVHPRYSRAQRERVHGELYPRLLGLAQAAQQHDIGLNIDAEESERLVLSLELLQRLCAEPSLAGWGGLGFVVQAYQKRAPAVLDAVIDLARRSGRRLMVRLVKGAYWDSEIKRAQLEGQTGYPVYTRKAHTDVAYLACAERLLAAPDAVFPQFATHNAHTVASIVQRAARTLGPWAPGQYEFQCLHGMGEPLYEPIVRGEIRGKIPGGATDSKLQRPCRIYAPVGSHETLLAYLVRRLLENGANTSFVNRIANAAVPLEDLVADPCEAVMATAAREGLELGAPHPAIVLPAELYRHPAHADGYARLNSRGLDLNDDGTLRQLTDRLGPKPAAAIATHPPVLTEPMLATDATALSDFNARERQPVLNPADHHDCVGVVHHATLADVGIAVEAAVQAAPTWAAVPASERARILEQAAELLDTRLEAFLPILIREAGKTAANAVAEVREAVDFLRFNAAQLRGQANDGWIPLGPVVCISPWNFPLAIFTGQVAAALAAGNTVLAKPAEQTPLVAADMVQLLWEAGVPRSALQLLPGHGETVGAALVADPRVQGVLFTGSTEVARLLQRALAGRLLPNGQAVPLIAETGGQNAMVVDSSALPEQVVADALGSAFDSAGQRCSALRVLCLQEDIAERVLTMLRGAMAELRVGDPRDIATDIGPLIDAQAQAGVQAHLDALRAAGCPVHQRELPAHTENGTFLAPALVEIRHLSQLQREVFGPVLHVLRWKREALPALMAQIRATGYGLTLGVHTRIDETVEQVLAQAAVGNVYVNRGQVGAVVGVQPFGGEGLSGTGPKAGGPLYLLRLLREAPAGAAARAVQAFGRPVLSDAKADTESPSTGTQDPHAWARSARELVGPTGESNRWRLVPRDRVLCLATSEAALLQQLQAVADTGGQSLCASIWLALVERLPAAERERVSLVRDWRHPAVAFDAVLYEGDDAGLRQLQGELAERPGAVIPVTRTRVGVTTVPLERLMIERAVSLNTAAAGGNASLMAVG